MDEKLLFCVSVREGDKMLHGAEWRETGQGRTLIDLFVEVCGNKVLGQQVQVLVSKERSFLEAAVVPVCTPLSTLAEKTQSYIQYILKNNDKKPLPIKSEVSKRYEAEKEHDDKKDGDVDLLHNWKNFYSSKTFHIDAFGMTDHISNDSWLQSANHKNFLLKTSFENMTVEEICDEIKRMKAKEVSKSKLSSWIEETKKQNLGIAPSRLADKIVETGDKNGTPEESIAHNKDSTRLSKCQNVSEPKNSKGQDSDSKTQTGRVSKIKPKSAPTVKRHTPVNTDRLAILAQPRKRFVNATKETKIPKKTNVTRKPVVKIKKKKPELKVSEGNTTPIRSSNTNDNAKESKDQKATGSTEQYFVEIFTNGISQTQDHLQKYNEPHLLGEHTPSKEFLCLPEEKSTNANSHNKKKTSTSNDRNPVHTERKDCNTENRLSKIETNSVVGTDLENKDHTANSRESSCDINDILNELHLIQSVHGMQQNGDSTQSDVANQSCDDVTSSKKTIGGYVKRENLSNFSLNSSEEEDVLFLKSPLVDCHWNSYISGDVNHATSNHSTFVKQCSSDSLISPNNGSNTKPKIELSLDCHSLMTSSSDNNCSSTITSSLDLAKMSSTPIIQSCDASISPSAISQSNSSLTSPFNGELWSNSRGVIFTKETSNSDNNRLRSKEDLIPNGSVIQKCDVPVETLDGGKKLIAPQRSPQPSGKLEEHSPIPEKPNSMSIASEKLTVIVHENLEKRQEQQCCTIESPEKQRKHWGNKIEGMDAILLASLQAFTLELRANTDTVASQIRDLYEDWRSKYETETSEDGVIAGHIINKPSPKQKEDGGQQQGMATIFRNLRKMEVNLKTMEQAAAAMLTELREKDDPSKEKVISPQNGIQRTKSFKWMELKTAARTKIKTKGWLNEKLSSDSDSDG